MTEPTRREFIRTSIGVTAAGVFPVWRRALSVAPAATKPLLQLQQEFVDLRFGMFKSRRE
jgi:hypothetical protein